MRKYEMITTFLTKFLQDEVGKTGLQNAVVGLSGGLDSAVVAVLGYRAFGAGLLCVKMPSHFSSQSSLDDADELCARFGLRSVTCGIEAPLKAMITPEMDNLRIGNLSSRLRMTTLFDISAREKALVLGTSNKSELMLGYGTLYGDLASAVNPIGDLYKTDVYALAAHLDIPQSIIGKPPSADLWTGQSDEAELGYSYAQIDAVLKSHVEARAAEQEMLDEGYNPALVELAISRIYRNQFKRRMPVIAKLTSRTINHDFNYPRDINL